MKKSQSQLIIRNLHAAIEGKEILHGINLTVQQGEIQAVMGPNGSGKSTLAYALAGHPAVEIRNPKSEIRNGSTSSPSRAKSRDKFKIQNSKNKTVIKIGKFDITGLKPEERARAGLFLAFQTPIAIPGVSILSLLRTAYQELHGETAKIKKTPLVQNPALARRWRAARMTLGEFTDLVISYARGLALDESFLRRGVHEGFSGGEKKKVEMLIALTLRPKFAIFDEIDTGLDIDALKAVANGITLLKQQGTGVILITHYQRILHHVRPAVVHVLVRGRIVETGGPTLAEKVENEGYSAYTRRI